MIVLLLFLHHHDHVVSLRRLGRATLLKLCLYLARRFAILLGLALSLRCGAAGGHLGGLWHQAALFGHVEALCGLGARATLFLAELLHSIEEGAHGRLTGARFPIGAMLTRGIEPAQLLRKVVDAVLDLFAVDSARLDSGFLHHIERRVVEMRLVIYFKTYGH